MKEATELLEKGADHHRREAVVLGDTVYPTAALLDDLWENSAPTEPVKLRVEAHGSLILMMDFLRDLRKSPNIRLDRMTRMEVWLRLNDRLRLEEYLQEMDSVARVRMHDSNLEVELAYPPEQFVPDGSDGSAVVESGVPAHAEAVVGPSRDAAEGAP